MLLLGLLLLSQVAAFVGRIALISSHQAIVEAMDNDAGEGVKVGQRSHWVNDNGFRYYGPLYYRIAQTLSWTSFSTGAENLPPALENEKAVHFSLMLLSLLSVYGLAWVLASLLTRDHLLKMLGVMLIAPACLLNPIWSQFLFTVHPDLFLAFLCAAAMAASLRMAADPDDAFRWKWAAFWWGLTLSTKLSALFLMPAQLVFLWKKGDGRGTFERCKRFTWFTLAVYLIVGFPQNFDFYGNIRSLAGLSRYSHSPTWESFLDWWRLWGVQAWAPLMTLLGFAVFLQAFPAVAERAAPSLRRSWWWIPAALSGMLLLSVRRLILIHDYYVFPFVAVAWVLAAWLFSRWSFRPALHSPWARGLVMLVGLAIALPMIPPSLQANQRVLARMRSCQPAFEKAFDIMSKVVDRGGKVLVTPYTPRPLSPLTKVHWEITDERMTEFAPSLMVMNPIRYYGRFTDGDDVSEYVKTNNKEWPQVQAFYRRFAHRNEAQTADGRTWKKLQDEELLRCGIEVWEP
ncbi:MAG: hypothetical protein KF865_06220 [Bdellovibrionaceae bacterium]|nr:hypothetical protein [Pseudobdellovibrionaceae bacterium]